MPKIISRSTVISSKPEDENDAMHVYYCRCCENHLLTIGLKVFLKFSSSFFILPSNLLFFLDKALSDLPIRKRDQSRVIDEKKLKFVKTECWVVNKRLAVV